MFADCSTNMNTIPCSKEMNYDAVAVRIHMHRFSKPFNHDHLSRFRLRSIGNITFRNILRLFGLLMTCNYFSEILATGEI